LPPEFTAVSLFSGAGGLDLGLACAGFSFVLHVERDEESCQTLRSNGYHNVLCEAVRPENVASAISGRDLDLLAAGPPCQPFSKSSQWNSAGAKGFGDDRANTIIDFIECTKLIQPRMFLLENVPQFIKMGGLRKLEQGLSLQYGGDYTIRHALLNAADFGVAQNRSRVFVVGIRGEEEFIFPDAEFGTASRPYRSVWDYLSKVDAPDRPTLTGKWTPLLSSIPPGKNYLHHTRRGPGENIFGWRTRFWSFLYKLDPNGLSPTVVANPSQNNGPFHWENRELSCAEAAALQSFPLEYKFCGSPASVRRQIGNAVPPLLAEYLGRELVRHLGGRVTRQIKLLPAKAKGWPILPELTPIPADFRPHVGEHSDHPGTGKGPRPRTPEIS
jgi:DNA (cytosine-5)-methyltransferase 1